jgi:hypothetical protein
MKWFRANTRHGSRLALFALLVQLALSFGHFHGAAAQTAQVGVTDADVAYATGRGTLDAASETVREQQPSNHHDTDQHPAHTCVICTVISLANNFLFATPPLLDLPRAAELLHLATNAEFAHLGSLHPPFQSRAPPSS